jgi:riboflavin synthase
MFTGIIEGLGTITGIRPSSQLKRLSLDTDFDLDQTKIGDSIAVDGACLTAVKVSGKHFEVDVSAETLEKTTLGKAKIGDRVNLERAMRLSDRIDGHLVSGHIDGIGSIIQRKSMGNAIIINIQVPESLCRYLIRKGSIAVDGISLTINTFSRNGFEVSIIPHTAKHTTLSVKKIGAGVNIETDMIGKYVERFVAGTGGNTAKKETLSESTPVNLKFLAETGFL